MKFNAGYFSNSILNSDRYYAHLPKEGDARSPELLAEHSVLVYEYARCIAEKQQLYPIISGLIQKLIPAKLSNSQLLAEEIEHLFWQAIAFHDLGKVNSEFQRKRMNNHAELYEVQHKFETKHSVIGMYIYLAHFWSDFLEMQLTGEESVFLCNVALYLSYPIYQHHSPALYQTQNVDCWKNEDLYALKSYLSLFEFDLNEEQINQFHSFLQNADFNGLFYFFNSELSENECSFPLFSLVKLNYSLLTAADYLATAHYMNDWKSMYGDFGLIDSILKQKIVAHVETSRSYNQQTYLALNQGDFINPDDYVSRSNTNLNILRRSLSMEVISNVRKNLDKNLFYIEAPTGGGKTNLSMLALAELLRADKNNSINKVYYVFPFTTLITQTYKALVETLGLNENEVAEIHSKATLQKKSRNESSDYLNYLDNLFMNYPVTLLSHMKFFDVLKTNQKETNYLLHRMANSVVIIDEIQSYAPKIWDKIVYFIANYATYFNMKFIVMSATLPKIGNLIDAKKLGADFVYLVKDKNKYFQNPNFCNRVQFDYSLLTGSRPQKEEKDAYLLNLKSFVFDKSEEYSAVNTSQHNSVFTIVEFIFKKTANDFYLMSIENNFFFDEIYLLSGTILEPRRKEIISRLKSGDCRNKKVLLVSTQVVEAGVDIDMDLGFKDRSLIDSEEQLAGRINRNVNKTDCKLYLFDCDKEKTLYGSDDRYKITGELDPDYYKKVLENKDFDSIYELVIRKIKSLNNSQFMTNLKDFEMAVSTLNYEDVDKGLKIIDSPNISVFVPLSISIDKLQSSKQILDDFNVYYDEYVSGADVWQVYENILLNGDADFVSRRINLKMLQGLMSDFVFSIFPSGKDYELLRTFGEEKYGFLYLENYQDVYSYENGINAAVLADSNFI